MDLQAVGGSYWRSVASSGVSRLYGIRSSRLIVLSVFGALVAYPLCCRAVDTRVHGDSRTHGQRFDWLDVRLGFFGSTFALVIAGLSPRMLRGLVFWQVSALL